ncbi:MAG TPA: metallophosphoesterase [Tepidisphaeraceae bacterium]|nr:metallophosphoesterase [Tepidisphaeraceae bacterium]
MRKIAHLSDIHFGTVEDGVREGVVADVHAHEPSLVVMSGDFTQRARPSQYRAAAEFMARLPRPQLVVPGNHDIPLYDVFTRFLRPLRNYTKFITKDLRPVYQDEELLVVGINTARPWTWKFDGFWKDGRISEEQLLDVKLRACDLPPEVFKIVVTHHPFIPPPGERVHGIVHGAKRALDQMEQCHVDMCLAGHLHMGYSGDVRTHHEAVKRSIISVQAGTATSNRRRGQPPEPNAYNLITINPNHVTIQVRAWDGTKFYNAAKTHFARLDGVWQREG